MNRAWLRKHYDWLCARDLRLLAGLAALGVLLLVFLQVVDEVTELDTDAFDRAVLLGFRHAPDDPIGSAWIENAVMHLSALGSGAVTGLIVICATGFVALAGHWRYALLLVACSAGAGIVMTLLKGAFERARPTLVTQLDPPGGLSFPSGHAMLSAALYVTLGVLIARTLERRRLRVFVVATGALIALIVGLSRVYLGVHYPTDVLAGWTLGLIWAVICGLFVQQLGRRGVEDVPPPAPE